jgi:hypothetical protein
VAEEAAVALCVHIATPEHSRSFVCACRGRVGVRACELA